MSGTLQASVVKDEASATNNLALNSSGGVTVGQNLTVTGTSTFTGSIGNVTTGNITSSGTVTDATGTLRPLVSGTAQASTSGTSIPFTGIPSWVKRITVMFNGVSTNGTNPPQLQIGTGGTATITGYLGANTVLGAAAATANFTTGFGIGVNTTQWAAANLLNGSIVLTNLNSNIWSCFGVTSVSNTTNTFLTSGSISLAGALDNLRIIASTTGNPADSFDAGSINILYE